MISCYLFSCAISCVEILYVRKALEWVFMLRYLCKKRSRFWHEFQMLQFHIENPSTELGINEDRQGHYWHKKKETVSAQRKETG
jgi:hypothetical protein